MRYNNFLHLLQYLKTALSFSYPVKVKRANIRKKHDSDCQLKNNTFLIRIQRSLTEPQAIDALLHEIAHCLAWNKEDDLHGQKWGEAYSIVYKKFLEWSED
jgi:hypothetical protein